jgi:hypothetical protein
VFDGGGNVPAQQGRAVRTALLGVINLAVPDADGRWGLQALEFPRPERLTLNTAAFTAPDTVTGSPDTSLIRKSEGEWAGGSVPAEPGQG